MDTKSKRIFFLSLIFSFFFSLQAKEQPSRPVVEKNQKIIGIIGGASWESTALYYKLINEAVRDRLGNLNSAQILLYSMNYDPIVKLELDGRWNEVGAELKSIAQKLQNAGADFVILACNTLHKVAPQIEAELRIPFLHIADAAGRRALEQNIRKLALLGTQFTMEDGFYASRLEKEFGLSVIVPNRNDRERLDQIIYQELCIGKKNPSSKEEILSIIQRLQASGAEAILLGCTELGLLIGSGDLSIPLYDTTLLHAEEAVNKSLEFSEQVHI